MTTAYPRPSDLSIDGKIDVQAGVSGSLHLSDWLPLARSLSPASIDLLYADPPFNTGQPQEARAGRYEDSWPDMPSYLAWLRERLEATLPALKQTASILLHLDFRTSHHARLLLDDLLGPDRFVNHLIWQYGLGGSSPRRFARKHDDILFYCLDPALYWFEPPLVAATSQRMKGRQKKSTDILDIPSINNMAAERTGYPTQKPLALLDLLIRACCPPTGCVLDPCCGSGTTLVAAINAGRRAIGADINPGAVAIARSRLPQAAGPPATLP
jgi:DNA modification methylase